MLSRFFVDRPIFAWVVAIVIMLAGLLSIFNLPVSQYPRIAPPQVTVSATYPGASAETMSRTVTQIIEQNMTGLDGLLYMSSTSDSTGRMTITLTFEAGTNPDIAQVQVQNKLSMAEPTLPEIVKRLGVVVQKSSASFLMVVGFVDRSHRMNSGDLGDYLTNNIEEPLARVKGVGETTVFGASYAMRIWMDPELMNKYKLMPSDVSSAISQQNVQVAAGDIAGQPTNGKRMITATMDDLVPKGQQLVDCLQAACDGSYSVVLDEDFGQVGGGSVPTQMIRSSVAAITPHRVSLDLLEKRRRECSPLPIIARISKDRLLLDVRTIEERHFAYIAQSIRDCCAQ